MAHKRFLAVVCTALWVCTLPGWSAAKKKKKEKEEATQVLELPKDPPQAVVAPASRLIFHVAPLSNRGLLSQQVRDGLKALSAMAHGAQIAKIRGFVAGSGDVRRVQAIVSELFTDRHQPLPTVTVVQVGALPLEGSQVLLQSIAVEKKDVNPGGVAFISGQDGPSGEAAGRLSATLSSLGVPAEGMRSVTCYMNSLDRLDGIRTQIAAAFPKSTATYVQLRRDSAGDFASCEAIAALEKAPGKNPEFGGKQNGRSQVALTGPGRLVLTGAQLAFGREEADLKLAFERMGKVLEANGATWHSAAVLNMFALTASTVERAARVRESVLAGEPAAGTSLIFEGLPSLDALLAIDVTAVADH